MSRHDFVATDGIVKAYAAMIPFPRAPLPLQYLQQVIDAKFYVESKPEACLIVTNNGKVWSYAVRPYHVLSTDDAGRRWMTRYLPSHYVPRDLHKRVRISSRNRLEGGYREPVEWAYRDIARRSKLPAGDANALQLNVAYEREAEAEPGHRLPGPCGPITYTGYSAKVGAYTLDQIHDAVVKAVAAAVANWSWRTSPPTPWKPSNLEVMLHSGNRAMGLAFAVGQGRVDNKRTISLNARLFKEYDLASIWRVVIHELCHHYREEALPGNEVDAVVAERIRQAAAAHYDTAAKEHGAAIARRAWQQAQQALKTHDTVFIRELAKVDDKVAANAYGGILFTEYADPSLVAQLQAKKAAKAAKINWAPTAGRVWIDRLADYTGVVYWVPLEGAKVKVGALTASTLRKLVNNIYAAAGPKGPESAALTMKTAVTYSDRWTMGEPNTLALFIHFCEERLRIPFSQVPT